MGSFPGEVGGSWGKSGEGGGPREGGRQGMASSGGQRGLPVDAWSPRAHRRKRGPTQPLPAPPPSPRHPPPCRPPEQKAEAGRAVLTGGGWAPGSECGLPTARVRRTPPPTQTDTWAAPGCRSWAQPRQLRTAELSPDAQQSSAPGLRQSPPSSPRFSKNEAGSSQKRLSSPQKSVQASTPPLPNRHPARCGEPCGEGDWGGCRGLSLLHPEGPRAGKARRPSSLGRGRRRVGHGSSGPDPCRGLAALRCCLYPQGPRSSLLSPQASPGKR